MMKLLPTAARIGFTGTPLLSSDNITARTFGGYVSVYGSDSGNRRISDDYPGALLWAFAGIFCHAGDSDGSGGGMECRGNQADFPGSGYGECDRHDAVSGFHASDVSGGLADDMHRGVL